MGDTDEHEQSSPGSSQASTPLFASSRQSTPNLQEVASDNDRYSTASTSPSTSSSCSSVSRQFRRSPPAAVSPGSGLQQTDNARDSAEPAEEDAEDSRDSPDAPDTADTSDEESLDVFRPRRRRRSSDDDQRFDITPKCPRPMHKWSALLEFNRFQLGGKALTYRRKCYGNLFMAQRLELMAKIEGHRGCVNSVNFNPEGDLLVTGSDDLNCMVWEWERHRLMVIFHTDHRSNVFQSKFMFHKNNRTIVTSARGGSVHLHQLNEAGSRHVESRKIAYHRGAVHKIAMHPALQDTLLTSGEDGCVCNIDIRLPNPSTLVTVRCANHRPVGLYSVAINPLRPFEFITSGTDQFVRVFDRRNLKANECVRKLCPDHLQNLCHLLLGVSCAVYNFDGTEILATYSDEDIYVFPNDGSTIDGETPGKSYLHRYQGHRNTHTVKGVNYFGQRSEYIVSGSDCGHIFLWDKQTSHIVNFLYGDEEGAVNVLEPNPVAPFLATSGFDYNVKIWAPSADEEPKLEGLRENTINNMRQRERDLTHDFPMNSSDRRQMLLYVMNLRPPRSRYFLQRPSHSSSSSDDETADPGRQCPTS